MESLQITNKFWSSPLAIFQTWLAYLGKSWEMQSSRLQIFFKKGVLKNFANFTGKYLCWSLFLIKLQAWKHGTLLKRDSNTDVFLWNLRNFLKNLFYKTPRVVASGNGKTFHRLSIFYYHDLGAIHKGCLHQGGWRGVSQMQTAVYRGRGELVKWGCLHFEKFCKFIFTIAQAGNCLCNWIQVTCYLTTPKSYFGNRKPK